MSLQSPLKAAETSYRLRKRLSGIPFSQGKESKCMMKIGNSTASGNSMPAEHSGSNMQTDPVSKNIQNRIASLRERLQSISSDENISTEDKMKKRQEIQQEISNLNQQLRQHEIEQRQTQQSKKQPIEDFPKPRRKSSKKGSGLSQASMQAMISADASMKQAQVQGSVASAMDGRAGVLKAEIKQDAGRNTEDKEAELAKTEQKSADAAAAQMNTVSDANKAMKEAARADAEDTERDSRTDKTDSKAKSKNKKSEDKDVKPAVSDTETQKSKPASENATGNAVDIRL